MSYLNPQSWSDVDSAGNPLTWLTRKNKLVYPASEMLRKAIIERCEVTSTAVPAGLLIERNPGQLYPDSWWSDFQATITALIPKFVNKDDNGGNWDGIASASFAPYWTEATLLTAIGDASRIAVPLIPKADWTLQQYKILNKLVWTKTSTIGYQDGKAKNFGGYTNFNTDWDTTYALMVIDYIAAPWVPGSFSPSNSAESFFDVSPPPVGPVGGYCWRSQAKHTVVNPSAIYSMMVDWYLYTATISGYDPVLAPFWNDDETMQQDKYWRFETSVAEVAAAATAVSIYPTDDESCPPKPPYPPWPPSTKDSYTGWRGSLPRAVLKWNATNGFKFVA